MNALDKTKKVLLGLKKHPSYSCKSCPYNETEDCTSHLMEDAFDVIAAQKEMMNRKEMAKAKPGFIVLTTGIVLHHDNSATWYDCCGTAVQVKDILTISDYGKCKGSLIQLKDSQQTSILVQETLEEILSKIAKGEEE